MLKEISVFARSFANTRIEVYKKIKIGALGIGFGIAAILGLSTAADAATFTVTSQSNTGIGTLRQAILDANGAPGPDTINFSPAAFSSSISVIGIGSELTISSDISIEGFQDREIIINAGTSSRIFQISGGTVQISDLTMLAGRVLAPANGGGIRIAQGDVTLNRVTFWNCSAGNGGAISLEGGTLNLTNSTVNISTATSIGGGLLINNSVATANIASSTFSSNAASQSGGSIGVLTGTVNVRNSIFADSTAPTGPEISGTVVSQGYNLIKNPAGTTITGVTTGNQLSVDPSLQPLNWYGGGSRTQGLNPGSPAIDSGDPSLATTTDQRKARRNTDGNRNGTAGVDIGAYEVQTGAFDYDGDGSADLSVMRTNVPGFKDGATSLVGQPRVWYFGRNIVNTFQEQMAPNPNGLAAIQFGFDDDIAAPGDYDGDGRVDAAVFRPTTGIWYINRSTAGFQALGWGLAGDIPVPADYDGDGKTDIAVVRSGVWYVLKSQQGYTGSFTLGNANSKPVPADYDGDLKADPAIFENGNWTVLRSFSGQLGAQFGLATDIPVPADFDGDRKANIAVFRPASGTWFVLRPGDGFDATQFGLAGDKLVPADYDGDGKTDIAVWRADVQNGRGNWHILQSRDGYVLNNFGFSTDAPTPNVFVRQ